MRLVNGRDIVARAYGWSRLGFVNKKLKHHAEATHLSWRSNPAPKRKKSRQLLYTEISTARNRLMRSEARLLVASGLLHLPGRTVNAVSRGLRRLSVPDFEHHRMVAYGKHDLEKVQADPATVNLGWD